MAQARLAFVATADDAPPPVAGVDHVVTDTAWTRGESGRPDLVPIRPAVSAVLARSDLYAEALHLVDAWAAEAGMVDLLTVDGVSYWFRFRETAWNWLHERLLWIRLVRELAGPRALAEVQVLDHDEALVDVARALAATGLRILVASSLPSPAVEARPVAAEAASPRGRGPRWLGRILPTRSAGDAAQAPTTRVDLLEARIAGWRTAGGPGVLAVSLGVRHTVDSATGRRLVDPHLDVVLARLREEGIRTGVLRLGLDHLRDADWPEIVGNADVFPASLLRSRWRPAGPGATVQSDTIVLPTADRVPLRVDDVDLAEGMLELVRSFTEKGMVTNARMTPRVSAMIDELRPQALLMTHEGHREPWILAAQRASVPTFSVQHGIIYATHPGYAHPRHPARILPTCTFVYGEYERRVLRDQGAYLPSEVEAAGSPRMELDRSLAIAGVAPDVERAAVRRALGVAEPDRLLVVSTTNGRVARRYDYVDILARILGGPLPRVHVVFKQHPGEHDEGPYRATLLGLAAAGRYAPPPMTVVREIDLYRLLRAADAHLGYTSTVLSEAVIAGTPNLIAAGQAAGDILGYVKAGVARPVHSVAELLAALENARPPDPDARQAFLDAHFRPGDASIRIAARIGAAFPPVA